MILSIYLGYTRRRPSTAWLSNSATTWARSRAAKNDWIDRCRSNTLFMSFLTNKNCFNSRLSHSRESQSRGYRYKVRRLQWERGVVRALIHRDSNLGPLPYLRCHLLHLIVKLPEISFRIQRSAASWSTTQSMGPKAAEHQITVDDLIISHPTPR